MSKVGGRKISHKVRESIRVEAIQKWLDGAKVKHPSEEYCWSRLPDLLIYTCTVLQPGSGFHGFVVHVTNSTMHQVIHFFL